MEVNLSKLEQEIQGNLKEFMGSAWDSLTKKDLELLKSCASDAAKLQIRALSDNSDSLQQEIKIVNATLGNITVAKYFPIKKIFWETVRRVATVAISILIKSAIAI
jgi:hypothetical protein